jgi:hypothetical protein
MSLPFKDFLASDHLRILAIPNLEPCGLRFFALGHPFVDAMLQQIGDYSFGGHTAVRVIEAPELPGSKRRAGYQFNFIVRGRVQREDGDEYVFSLYTVVISADGTPDEQLASLAAGNYSKDEFPSRPAERLLTELDEIGIDRAYKYAQAEIERKAQFWDWDEDVELIGLAKVVSIM